MSERDELRHRLDVVPLVILERILVELWQIRQLLQREGAQVSAELDALRAQVAQTVGVEQSAIALIQGVAAQIAALAAQGGTGADFVALSDSLKGSADALAGAVASVPTP